MQPSLIFQNSTLGYKDKDLSTFIMYLTTRMFLPSVTNNDQWRIKTINLFQYNSDFSLGCWGQSAILPLGGGDPLWAKEVTLSQQGKTNTMRFEMLDKFFSLFCRAIFLEHSLGQSATKTNLIHFLSQLHRESTRKLEMFSGCKR